MLSPVEPDTNPWDAAADTFDREADHGLTDPAVRRAWTDLLRSVLPARRSRVLDLGCGTGSLSLLAADLGHRVHGIDLSARMLEVAVAKANGPDPTFARADVAHPPVRAAGVDVVLARHVVWALDDPAAALRGWVELLAPAGRLVLVEGRWSTGAGIDAGRLRDLVRPLCGEAAVRHLDDPAYWGRPINDDRYLLVARRAA